MKQLIWAGMALASAGYAIPLAAGFVHSQTARLTASVEVAAEQAPAPRASGWSVATPDGRVLAFSVPGSAMLVRPIGPQLGPCGRMHPWISSTTCSPVRPHALLAG